MKKETAALMPGKQTFVWHLVINEIMYVHQFEKQN